MKNKDIEKELAFHKDMLHRAKLGYKKAQDKSDNMLMFAHSKVALKATKEIKRLKAVK